MNKKIISITMLVLVIITITLFKSKISQATPDTASSPVIVSDLAKAGFTGVKQEVPLAGGRFSGPALYFAVSDKVMTDSTSEAPNIVMVSDLQADAGALAYTYGSNSHAFDIAGGQGKEGIMFDARITINFVKNGHYVVIIGPNKQKIEALASLASQKIQ
jgi:hypothetical protein